MHMHAYVGTLRKKISARTDINNLALVQPIRQFAIETRHAIVSSGLPDEVMLAEQYIRPVKTETLHQHV